MPTETESIPASAASSFRRNSLLWFVLALGCIEGFTFNFIPVSFSVFQGTFHVSLEQLGSVQTISFIGTALFGVVGGSIILKLGTRWAAVAILIMLLAALLGIGASPVFVTVLVAAFLLGFALMGLEVASGSIISDSFPKQRQHVFFIWGIINAAGATVGPAVLGLWFSEAEVTGRSWRLGFFGVGALVIGMIVWGSMLALPTQHAFSSGTEPTVGTLPVMREILSHPAIYLVSLAVFLHGIAQVGMISWVGQLYQKRYDIGVGQAAYFISFNSAGFFLGRFVLGWLTRKRRIPELLVLGVCALGGTVAFVVTIASPSYWMGLVSFAVAGVFISGDAPSIYSYTGFLFEGRTAVAFALMNGLGNTGSAAGPYLIGLIGSHLGLDAGIMFMPLFSLGLAALAFAWLVQGRMHAIRAE